MEPAPETGPKKQLSETFSDAMLLLEFLGQRADSRLQAHFDDTRPDLASPMQKLATPPCKSYKKFLNRLVSIGHNLSAEATTGQGKRSRADTNRGDDLSDTAFLSFSRDFLAAVAAPATVNSIRVTRAYVDARRQSIWRWLAFWTKGSPSRSDNLVVIGARRLATRVVWIENIAITLTAFTLLASAYAFSGQMILDNRQKISDNYDQIGRDMGALVKDLPVAERAAFNPLVPPGNCDPGYTAPAVTRTVRSETRAYSPAAFQVRSDATVDERAHETSLPTPSGAESQPAAEYTRRCALYWRLKRVNEDLVAVTMHLVSWTQVVVSRRHLSNVFGIDNESMRGAAALHHDWCQTLQFAEDVNEGSCFLALRDLVFHTKEVAESLLGCIALYVLPTLFGCLGAAACGLRTLRRKVDLSLVTMTDRGRLQQDMILGLLCGAIMGLFVSYLSKGTTASGLGLSAIALLAGYNVSGAFGFLDELSSRLFRPAKSEVG